MWELVVCLLFASYSLVSHCLETRVDDTMAEVCEDLADWGWVRLSASLKGPVVVLIRWQG